MQFLRRALLLFSAILPGFAFGLATLMQAQAAATVASATVSLPDAPSQPAATQSRSRQNQAETQLNQEEHQRILGVVPNFNTTDNQNAAPLSARQKFRLAFRSAVDPFTFVAVAADAGISQAKNDFPGYGQGAAGYGKRFGASYADSFDGTLWGNAIFPALLHQDPRYFRKGRGSFTRRLLYAVSTTVWARNDNGTWGPELCQRRRKYRGRRHLESLLSCIGPGRRADLSTSIYRDGWRRAGRNRSGILA